MNGSSGVLMAVASNGRLHVRLRSQTLGSARLPVEATMLLICGHRSGGVDHFRKNFSVWILVLLLLSRPNLCVSLTTNHYAPKTLKARLLNGEVIYHLNGGRGCGQHGGIQFWLFDVI